MEILKILKPFEEKVLTTSDGRSKNLHPLCPSVRRRWILEKFDFPELNPPPEEAPDKSKEQTRKNNKKIKKQDGDGDTQQAPPDEQPPEGNEGESHGNEENNA